MKAIGRAVILALLAGSAATSAAAETRSAGFGAGVKVSRGSLPGGGATFGDHRWRGHDGRRDRDRRDRRRGRGRSYESELGYTEYDYRHSRTSYENGYFGQRGTTAGGVYDYDRGYPYDFYNGQREIERARIEPVPAGESWCETQRVWDDHSGREMPVRICRN
jgi:hypothetical protein